MDDYNFSEGEIQAVPRQSALSKRITRVRPLVAEGSTPSVAIKPVQQQEQVEAAVATSASSLRAANIEESTATPIADAFTASVGGYSRDLYNLATQEKANEDVDPAWDAGAMRESFRSQYGMQYWEALEHTKNQDMYNRLVQKLDEKAGREEKQGNSLVGTGLGLLADPVGLLSGGAVLKGAQLAAKAYKFSKPVALAAGATAEASVYGGIEAAVQIDDVGYVHNKASIASTMALSGALHFGLGAAFVPKSSFQSVPKTTLADRLEPVVDGALPSTYRAGDRVEPFFEDVTLGDDLIKDARTALAKFSQTKADELAAGARVSEPEVRTFPLTAYPSPEIAVANVAEEAIADAGSAANKTRAAIKDDVIIKSDADAITDIQESAYIADKANRELIGQEKFDWLNSPSAAISTLTSNTLRGLKSKSAVVRTYALKMGADSTGIFRQIESPTAYDKDKYNTLIRNHHANVHDEYKGWLKRTGQGGYIAAATYKNERAFNTALREEMEARWNSKDFAADEIVALDSARWKNVDPEIKRAADALDKGNQVALDLMKKYNVLGAEGLSPISRGYVSRRMSGDALRNLFSAEGKAGYTKVQQALGRRYFEAFHAMQAKVIADLMADTSITKTMRNDELARIKPITKEKAQTIATGVMERALDRSAGIGGTTVGLLDRAARDEIKAILESKKLDYTEIEHTFNLLDKRLGSKSGSNSLKGRMDVDIATPDAETGIKLLEYFDNDLNRLTSSYAEEMSGRIALARQGIANDNDFENILNAANNSHKGTAKEVEDDLQLLRDMHSVLLGRPLEGQGKSKFVNFVTNLNSLQTLGQVGAAQGAESSLHTARLGIGSALKAVPVLAKILVGARKGLLDESSTNLLKGVEAWNGPVGEYYRTHRPMTEVLERLNTNGEVAHMADRLMKAGQQVNGFVSFMHQVMETQLKIVAVDGTRTFAKEIQSGVLTKRIADAGFSEASMKALKREIDTHAEFIGGDLHDMHFEKWSDANAEHFTRNIHRLSGQLIQRDFAGETASWMHKDMGRMLLSLRGYSVKAYNKQLVRNVQLHDATAAQSLVYGLAFSTLAYTAKVYAVSAFREDRDEFLEQRLSGDSLVFGAVGYSALGAFLPDLARPLASWNAEAGEAGAIRSSSNALTALIPGLSPVARLLKDVDTIGSTSNGDKEITSAQVRHLMQSVLGNSYPVALAVNAAIEDE